MGSSPQAAASPHLTASPQVPSPQGQTLDLSVNRLHRYLLIFIFIIDCENETLKYQFYKKIVFSSLALKIKDYLKIILENSESTECS